MGKRIFGSRLPLTMPPPFFRAWGTTRIPMIGGLRARFFGLSEKNSLKNRPIRGSGQFVRYSDVCLRRRNGRALSPTYFFLPSVLTAGLWLKGAGTVISVRLACLN